MHFITIEKEQNNYAKNAHCFCSSALLNLVVFVGWGHSNISCPRVQGTLATPLVGVAKNLPYLLLAYLYSVFNIHKTF